MWDVILLSLIHPLTSGGGYSKMDERPVEDVWDYSVEAPAKVHEQNPGEHSRLVEVQS